MNKYSMTFLLAFSFLTSTSAVAVIPLTDPPQSVQTVLNDIQSAATYTQQQTNTILAFKTRVSNGWAGLRRYMDLDNLSRMFEQKLSTFANKQLGDVFGGEEFKKLVGNDIANQFNINDLANMDLDKLKELGIGQVGDLTQDQIKEILGNDLAGKLTEDQIRSLLNDPKGLLDFLSGNGGAVQVQQAAASNQGVLNILGTPKDVFKKTAASAQGSSPNGNRSDAFGGTGNGSTPQAQAALDAFKTIQSNIVEKAQVPAGNMELKAAEIQKIRLTQVQIETDVSLTGLATAWLRQTMRTRSIPDQEKEISKKITEAKDIRESTKAVSYTTLIGVEAQNNANEIFAENLKVFAARTNQRVGNTSGEGTGILAENTGNAAAGEKSPETPAKTPTDTPGTATK